MNPYNLFKTNKDDFQFLLDINSSFIYVNSEPKRGLVTNTRYINEFNDKYISTNYNLSRGDIVYYESLYWIIMTQVGVPRYESYKALMRQAEHDIIFNLSYTSNPQTRYLLKCPAIIQQTSDFNMEYSRTVETITVNSEIHVFIQDNVKTRKVIELTNSINGRIVFGRRSYEITGVSTANKGVLDITCTLTTQTEKDDYDNEIYNPPANFGDYIDDSMYHLQDGSDGGSGELQLPDESISTDVGTINVGKSFMSYDVTWNVEVNKNKYIGFAGYRFRVYKETMFGEGTMLEEQIVTTENTNIAEYEKGENGLSVTIESIFSDGIKSVFLKPQKMYF
ncbi:MULTISPECIES: hypothetical protein [Lysinibacillus]|uniref:hypothetical protein n=1 Tax=Lysinibacillus TaxID=400634 RepID=UPI00214ABEFD|nr:MULTISPECIES: hypothetical protein [Lysinibacillus]UUV26394.1 hypothetical protein NP781_07260 [Lysinibacillus sp. FN11]UYB49275.1 hypothetical protein OCI51_10010 [Lysinibacillus capsici]